MFAIQSASGAPKEAATKFSTGFIFLGVSNLESFTPRRCSAVLRMTVADEMVGAHRTDNFAWTGWYDCAMALDTHAHSIPGTDASEGSTLAVCVC
eukprot:5668539-Prymnesium_polylepis.1